MSDFALKCPFCQQPCDTIRCERYAETHREVHVSAYHRQFKWPQGQCQGYLTPSKAAAALTVKATDKLAPIQPAQRSGT